MFNKNQTASIRFTQKRSFSGKTGENILILDKTEGGWEFTHLLRITKSEPAKGSLEFQEISIEASVVKEYKEEKKLDEYIYTLGRVRNFQQPIRHFNRKYSRLTNAEFDAIDTDKIFYPRAILGTVLNALPALHQQSYLIFLAENEPSLLLDNIDIFRAIARLKEYLNYAIIHPAKCLVEAQEMLIQLIETEYANRIGFGNLSEDKPKKTLKKSASRPHLIETQIKLIKEYLYTLDLENNELFKAIERDKDNAKYKIRFKYNGLPIKLKIDYE